jgi:DnaJ like chaperone protein
MEANQSPSFVTELRRVLSEFFTGGGFDERHERTFEILFRLLGHVSRIDGEVSQDERELAGRIMEEIGLPVALRDRALAAYANDKDTTLDLKQELEAYLDVFPAGSTQVSNLFECLVRLVHADGRIDAREQAFLDELTKWLGIPSSYLDWKLQALRLMPMH